MFKSALVSSGTGFFISLFHFMCESINKCYILFGFRNGALSNIGIQ